MSILGVLVATQPWETGIVILSVVRETDHLSAIYSWKQVCPMCAFASEPWLLPVSHCAPVLGEHSGEWLESLGNHTILADIPSIYDFKIVWLTLVKLVTPAGISFSPSSLLRCCYFDRKKKNQSCTSNCSDIFFIPKYSHAPPFLSATCSHVLTLMFFLFLCVTWLERRVEAHLRLCRDS